MNQPISKFLPEAYRTQETSWIYAYLDETVNYLEIEIQQFIANYLVIETATDQGLNYIAKLNGLSDLFWDNSWNVASKRILLQNYRKLVTEIGNENLVNWVFSVFDLDAKLIKNTGWILGVSEFPITFNDDVFSYSIETNLELYSVGTKERQLIEQIKNTFIPKFINEVALVNA